MLNPDQVKSALPAEQSPSLGSSETIKESSAPTSEINPSREAISRASLPIAPRVKSRQEEAITFSADASGSFTFPIPPSGAGGLARRIGKHFQKLPDREEHPINFISQGLALKMECVHFTAKTVAPTIGTAVFCRIGTSICLIEASDLNGRKIDLKSLVAAPDPADEAHQRHQLERRRQAERRVLEVKKMQLAIFSEEELPKVLSSRKMPESALGKIEKIENIFAAIIKEAHLKEKVAQKSGWAHKFVALCSHVSEQETLTPHLDTLILALHPREHRYRSLTEFPSFMALLEGLRKSPGVFAFSHEARDRRVIAPIVDVLLEKLWGKNS